jgi:trehalose/maltose hydrolase-like predicted phosphorylase
MWRHATRDSARPSAPWATATSPPRSRTGVSRRRSALPATYIAGCFNELQTEIAGRVSANESLVNAPNWLPPTFAAEDGPWLGEEAVTILSDCQELDLRRGVLTRRRLVSDSLGHITSLTSRRFVHMGAARRGDPW